MNPLSATSWLSSLGTLGVLVVLFAETGLLVGFFLPGDSLLFTAGLFCSTSAATAVHLSLPWTLFAAVVGALAGAQVGFILGRRGGRAILARVHNRRLHQGMLRAEHLLTRYGSGKAIVLARFIPVVRTVLNPMAGVLSVPTRTFTLWQVSGGVLWSVGITLSGYALGSTIPGVDQCLLPMIAVIVLVSLIPLALELRHARDTGAGDTEQTVVTSPEGHRSSPANGVQEVGDR
jgi:membrane-associated protein